MAKPPWPSALSAESQVGPIEQEFRHLIGSEDQCQHQRQQCYTSPTEEPAPVRFHVATLSRARGFSLTGHEQMAARIDKPIEIDQASE